MEKKKRECHASHTMILKPVKVIFCFVLPILFTVGVILAVVWGNDQRIRAEDYKTTASNMYRQAYSELVDSVGSIQIALSKLLVSEAPSTLADTLNNIWRESGVCVGVMGQIPQSHVDNYELNAFLIRIGDYAYTLSASVVRGKPISETDRKQLVALYEASKTLYSELQLHLEEGSFPTDKADDETFYSSENSVDTSEQGGEEARFPVLNYDGDFSESTEKMLPRGLKGELIDEERAAEIAESIFGGEVKLDSVSAGRIPAYDFSGTADDGSSFDAAITARGGKLLWFRRETDDSDVQVEVKTKNGPNARLVEIAKDFLTANGFSNMQETFAVYYGNCVEIRFVPVQQEILIYNDLVKVVVDACDLSVCAFDASEYYFNSTKRNFVEERISIDEAKTQLSPFFTVDSVKLACIPASAQTERLCYEFRGHLGEDKFIVYLDAENGDEVRILRLISDETGDFTL